MTFTIAASEVTTGASAVFVQADITNSGCVTQTFTETVTERTFTLLCTVAASSAAADVSVSVAGAAFNDPGGNLNIASAVFVVTTDGTGPSVSLTVIDASGTSLSTGDSSTSLYVIFRFVLSEHTSRATGEDFTVDDITRIGCSSPAWFVLTGVSTRTYELKCYYAASTTTSVAISAAEFQDPAGNGNTMLTVFGVNFT